MLVLAADTVVTAAIAAGGVVLGGVLTTVGTVITARSKVAELEVAHRQKREDAHLEAAHAHIDTIYIPLNAALSTLADAYLVLREQTGVDSGNTQQEALDAFHASSRSFLDSVSTITGGGKDAFLTADLDGRLRDFTAFLRASQAASDVSGKVVIQTFLPRFASASVSRTAAGVAFRVLQAISAVGVAGVGFGMSVETEEVLAAPVDSRDFERRFQRDMTEMKASIRDVTLGPSVA